MLWEGPGIERYIIQTELLRKSARAEDEDVQLDEEEKENAEGKRSGWLCERQKKMKEEQGMIRQRQAYAKAQEEEEEEEEEEEDIFECQQKQDKKGLTRS